MFNLVALGFLIIGETIKFTKKHIKFFWQIFTGFSVQNVEAIFFHMFGYVMS